MREAYHALPNWIAEAKGPSIRDRRPGSIARYMQKCKFKEWASNKPSLWKTGVRIVPFSALPEELVFARTWIIPIARFFVVKLRFRHRHDGRYEAEIGPKTERAIFVWMAEVGDRLIEGFAISLFADARIDEHESKVTIATELRTHAAGCSYELPAAA